MPTDPRLITALRGATVDRLREDAELALLLAQALHPDNVPKMHRLAALCLAVAKLEERTDFTIEKAGEAVYIDYDVDDSWRAGTLSAALADLLEGM